MPPPTAPLAPHDPTPEEIATLRASALSDLTQAQQALDQAARVHEDFRTTHWLPTPRRRRFPLTRTKDQLRKDLDQARADRDALLTHPRTLVALTPQQRESATHLSREGRRRIERAHQVPPIHPHYAPTAPHLTPAPAPDPQPEEAPTP